jgi:hypothetical protein
VGEESSVGRANGTIRKPMIKLERSGRAITNVNKGNGTIGVELIIDDPPEIAMSIVGSGIKGSYITKNPFLPSSWFTGE